MSGRISQTDTKMLRTGFHLNYYIALTTICDDESSS